MIDPKDMEATVRTLEVLSPITIHAISCVGTSRDRLAMRVALTLLLDRVSHPEDDVAAARLVAGLRGELGL